MSSQRMIKATKEAYVKTIIREGKLDRLKSQYVEDEMSRHERGMKRDEKRKKIPESVFNSLVEADPSKTRKYLEWMIKRYIDEASTFPNFVSMIKELIKQHHDLVEKHRVKGKEADIGQIKSVEEMLDIVQKYEEPSKAEIKRGTKGGTEFPEDLVVFENDKVVLLKPKTKADKQKIGRGCEWCTATMSSANLFNHYFYDSANNFIVIVAKPGFTPPKEEYSKIAVQIPPSGNRVYWDMKDRQMPASEVQSFLKAADLISD